MSCYVMTAGSRSAGLYIYIKVDVMTTNPSVCILADRTEQMTCASIPLALNSLDAISVPACTYTLACGKLALFVLKSTVGGKRLDSSIFDL